MDDLLQLQDYLGIGAVPVNLISTLFNLLFCIAMSFIVRFFYVNYSTSLTGKAHIGSVIPLLSSVVFLVIVIVKSSLALSLGLVGALSIVRFRTPVKEPEELVYLFLTIAIGLGYGAGYTQLTSLIVLVIIIVIYLFSNKSKNNKSLEYNIIIDWPSKKKNTFSKVIETLGEHCDTVKLIRLDSGESVQSAVLLLAPSSNIIMDDLINELNEKLGDINISFFEAKTNW